MIKTLLQTVRIRDEGGEVRVINASDFDELAHTRVEDVAVAVVEEEDEEEVAKTHLDALLATPLSRYRTAIRNLDVETLRDLYDAETRAGAKDMIVRKIG